MVQPFLFFCCLIYIHLRLDELFGGDDWFGSKNMLQLQPVNGDPVYEKLLRNHQQLSWDVLHL